jgi:magnesium-transporting ATPase (P-type)
MAFMALVLIHPFQAMNCGSQQFGWWRLPSNPLIWVALATLVGLQWLSISLSPLSRLLGTVPLAPVDWLVLASGVLWPVVSMEFVKGRGGSKAVGRRRPNRFSEAPRVEKETTRNH